MQAESYAPTSSAWIANAASDNQAIAANISG
jgi:hypothetical protein